jgi:hypothetical protein
MFLLDSFYNILRPFIPLRKQNEETVAKIAIDAEVIKHKSNVIYYCIGVAVLTVGVLVLCYICKDKIWNAYIITNLLK